MNAFISKPIIAAELNNILFQFLRPDSITLGDAPKNLSKPGKDAIGGQPILEILRDTQSINIETGLLNNNSDIAFYTKTLRNVVSELPKEEKYLQAEYEAKDWKNFGIRAHALKGILATIGAETLSASAKELELAAKEERFDDCKNKGPAFISALTEFENTLSDVVKSETASFHNTATQEKPSTDTHFLVNDRMGALAEALDGGNKKIIRQRLAELSEIFIRLDIVKVEELIDNYDYEEAAELLRSARKPGGESG
jgi:HPt (histidine-containing phosphotransfer) domain-containing protein